MTILTMEDAQRIEQEAGLTRGDIFYGREMSAAEAMYLKVPQQLAAIESLGLPFPWRGRALAMRVSAFMQANDPRLELAMEEMSRFLDQGGSIGGEAPPFVVQVKPVAPAAAPVQSMVIGSQAQGGE